MKRPYFIMPDGHISHSYEDLAKMYYIDFKPLDVKERYVDAVMRAVKLIGERTGNTMETVKACEKIVNAKKKLKELGVLDEEAAVYRFELDDAEITQAFVDSELEVENEFDADVLDCMIEAESADLLLVKLEVGAELNEEEQKIWDAYVAEMNEHE